MEEYKVKDLSLAEKGALSIEWAKRQMPVLSMVQRRLEAERPLESLRIAACLHVTKETAVLIHALEVAGAEVSLCASNPLSTQDAVAAALAKEGIHVYAWRGQSTKDYYECIRDALNWKPQITIDDGADLVTTIHVEQRNLLQGIIGGTEETTTGVMRLRAMEREGALGYPIIAVNDARSKNLFDNPIGTGQSTLDGIMRATNVLIAGKNVVVVGFGQVGSGIAERARGLGAKVTIVEVDPFRALRAAMLGFNVASMNEASSYGDLFITATGNIKAIRGDHFLKMKDGAILANSGHFDVEICKEDLEALSISKRWIRDCVDEYLLRNGKRLYLLAEGRLVNLACAEGHPSEVMDLSFSIQALSIEYIAKNARKLPVKVLEVPKEVDEEVARLKLRSMGLSLEELTEEQRAYMKGWVSGT